MRILIIGAGAVGCSVAIAAVNAGMETAILDKGPTADSIREHGLKRTGLFGEIVISPDRISVHKDYSDIGSGFDYVVSSVKSVANRSVAEELAAHKDVIGDTGRIIIFQNGWGNDEPYLEFFPASQVYNARIITGFEAVSPGVSNVTVHTAPILLGSLYGASIKELEPLAKAISDSGIPSETSEELESALWAKMLYNTTLNPLGAILDMKYGDLASSQNLVSIMNRLIDESYAVMDAAGYKTFWKTADEFRDYFYGKQLPDTFEHRASTLQDIEKHHKTEIDTLNGCIVRIGKKYGVATPTHTMIVELIKGIEDIRCIE